MVLLLFHCELLCEFDPQFTLYTLMLVVCYFNWLPQTAILRYVHTYLSPLPPLQVTNPQCPKGLLIRYLLYLRAKVLTSSLKLSRRLLLRSTGRCSPLRCCSSTLRIPKEVET